MLIIKVCCILYVKVVWHIANKSKYRSPSSQEIDANDCEDLPNLTVIWELLKIKTSVNVGITFNNLGITFPIIDPIKKRCSEVYNIG